MIDKLSIVAAEHEPQPVKIIIDLPPDLEQDLTRKAVQAKISLPTLILQVLKQITQKPSIPQWPDLIFSYQGISDFPAFESYRDELLSLSDSEPELF